jgi:hypothetical protein
MAPLGFLDAQWNAGGDLQVSIALVCGKIRLQLSESALFLLSFVATLVIAWQTCRRKRTNCYRHLKVRVLLQIIVGIGALSLLAQFNKQHAYTPSWNLCCAPAALWLSHFRRQATTKDEWKFQKYVPSKFEALWLENIRTWQADVCAAMQKHTSQVDRWINLTSRNMQEPFLEMVEPDPELFSRHVYKTASGKTKQLFVEPLAGLLRHPYVCRYFVRRSIR